MRPIARHRGRIDAPPGMGTIFAAAPGTWPDSVWPFLILPLCIAVSVVYKSIKCETMRRAAQAAEIAFWILLGMGGEAVALAGLVKGVEMARVSANPNDETVRPNRSERLESSPKATVMDPGKVERRPGVLSGLWKLLWPASSKASPSRATSPWTGDARIFVRPSCAGDDGFLGTELSKAQLNAAANTKRRD